MKSGITDLERLNIEYRLLSGKLGVEKYASQYNLERMVLPTIFIET